MADSRRSTAAQFFHNEQDESFEAVPTMDRVVELINEASLAQRDQDKVGKLRMVQELIIHKEKSLLDNFFDEMIAFQSDKSLEVRKFIISFMEEACKKDPEMLPKVVVNLSILLQDDNVQVVKKVILCMTQLYKVALQWVAKMKTISDVMKQTWQYLVTMKHRIMDMLDSDNDGVRTHAIRFIESVIITLSRKAPDSDIPKKAEGDICLDQVPHDHALLKYKKLEEDGSKAFEMLLEFQCSNHISSTNLMTCMGTLSSIAKQRPEYMPRVVTSFETLHVNLPPTLAKSQVSSVRKHLKMQMLQLLRHPASQDFFTQITTLLTDLGATQAEVMKNMPKIDENSRKRKAEDSGSASKKPKTEVKVDKDDDDDYGMTPFVGVKSTTVPETKKQSAIDITAEDLLPKLTPQNVADLVLLSMVMLPETLPPQFQSTYTPIAAAGTQAQIKHLARLLATQLTAAGLGKGVHEVEQRIKAEEAEVEATEGATARNTIKTVVGGSTQLKEEENSSKFQMLPAASMLPPQTRKGVKQFKLASITNSFTETEMENMALEAIKRILKAEKAAMLGNASAARVKILTSLVSQFGGAMKNVLKDFIFEDLRNRADLAVAWIYQEYANYQGYNISAVTEKTNIASYDECLTRLLNGLLERPDQREGLFSRLILESPIITPNAIQILRKYCQDETRIYLGMTTLKELIIRRPCMKLEFLDVLLDFTCHSKLEVRSNAIRVVKKLHERPELFDPIERSAMYNLKFLLQPQPPSDIFLPGRGRPEYTSEWTEEVIKVCLYLYLGLLPVNHTLIHELATVYTSTTADIKRTILRVLETPVKGMGMHSPDLLLLVENCPKGAETFVTRVIHILTDKAAPSQELVERVRDLYQKRVSDVRFLIPVLTGLSKNEVIAALPKLIKLNPVVVKEVFNRLLTSQGEETNYSSPVTPAEVLIALHNIDPNVTDMKTIIKATNMCFSETSIYTQEVLALVMKELMEQNPIPTLFMRTVIQSLAMYPKLIGYVMNILQRLITKQVWKQKRVWEGFVKCCQRTKGQSFPVLLQLPAAQLKSVFELSPDLREPLLEHVKNYTPHQKAHVPRAIMVVLEKDPMEEQRLAEKAKKEEEERRTEQEQIYQEKLERERKKQQEKQESSQESGKEEVTEGAGKENEGETN